jgi:predicted MPP superfamily phosphohydrolase
LLLLAGIALAAIVAHAVFVAPFRLTTTEVELPVPQLPAELDGYRLAILADLHTGIPGSLAQAWRAVRAANESEPDMVVLLGDYGHSYKRSRSASARGYRRSMEMLTPVLRSLRARDAIIALLGNHDHYFDAPAVRRWLESLGARVLVNEHVVLRRGDAGIALLGIDDAKEGHADIEAAITGLPDGMPRVLLTHNPDGVFATKPAARIALAVAGHTHGGQVVLPWYGAPATFCRICRRLTASGWVPNDHVPLFVTTGVGGMIPFRINAVPEIVIARLRRAPEGRAAQHPV